MKPLLLSLAGIVLITTLASAANPTPLVNQPLIPASVAPGGPNFTLTVNGTGFVPSSTVNWNGSSRATTFVSNSQLTATILSGDIATASTASVTVASPAPGGGVSNAVFLPVRQPASFVSLNTTSFGVGEQPAVLAVGDFNGDGSQDVATVLYNSSDHTYALQVLLGKGDGTFTDGVSYSGQYFGYPIIAADVNNDGNLDLLLIGAVQNGQSGLGVMLGNGDGTFQPLALYQNSACCAAAVGDFNRDGNLDVAAASGSSLCISLGIGGGAFSQPNCILVNGTSLIGLTAGDFNRDGILDLAFTASIQNGYLEVGVMLGNGDGTFQQPQVVFTQPFTDYLPFLSTADFNGDGNLDLAVADENSSKVLVFLGNGNGAFRPSASYTVPFEPQFFNVADMNGDGKLDLVVQDYGYYLASVAVLLGNGDGTFQNYVGYGGLEAYSLAVADLNNDGRLDVVSLNYNSSAIDTLLQDNGSALSFSPDRLDFPLQLLDTVSKPQVINVTNTGSAPVTFSQISNTPNFSHLDNCITLQPGKSCKVGVFFTPTVTGDIFGNLGFTDNAGGSAQMINLAGVSTIVSLKPSSLDFGSVPVGHVSPPQHIVLTNKGNGNLTITQIAIGGTNAKDFSQVNACPNKLSAGSSCSITVYFRPRAPGSRSGVLGVSDNGGGSPQKVPLSGTGT